MKKWIYGAMLAILMCVISLTAVCEGLLPSLSDVYGVAMPSLGDVLNRYADSEKKEESGSTVQHWSGISEDDFEAFSAYLAECHAELRNYTVENGVLSAMIGKNGKEFRFQYDPKETAATIVYPKGTFDERSYQASCKYELAKRLMNNEKYEEAIIGFEELKGYFDSAAQIATCKERIMERAYRSAIAMLDAGQNMEAYKAFKSLQGYKDVDNLLSTDRNLLAAATAAHEEKIAPFKKIGGIAIFGTFEQDDNIANGKEDIEWLVLDYDEANNRALIIANYGLYALKYNDEYVKEYLDVTWETCTLRRWLNSSFLRSAFSPSEQSAILTTMVDNSKAQGNSKWNTDGGNNTQDKIFLLSYAEAEKYFSSDEARQFTPTAYARAHGAWTTNAPNRPTWEWWLRSPGSDQNKAAYVYRDGSLRYSTLAVVEWIVIRPAFWLDLNSKYFAP